MKIKNLILKNFGPFVGENQIDFSELEDIFQIGRASCRERV